MSQGTGQNELREKTQKLLQGPLKHVRAAALAAALLPLASVAATPAAAQVPCPLGASGGIGICGVVWNDVNNNGVQDAGETPIEGAKVTVSFVVDGVQEDILLETNPTGQYLLNVFDTTITYAISAQIPVGAQPSPSDSPSTIEALDSDGALQGAFSVATVTPANIGMPSDFGFYTAAVPQPGTGTPGYWKNHPEAWPLPGLTIGVTYYTKAQAITLLGKVGKDKSITMFSSLLSAILNQKIGNEDSCVSGTIIEAQKWMTAHPAGSGVAGSSDAWAIGEPMHMLMDAYNNGLLCAKHRN